jgi:hypothetical protein
VAHRREISARAALALLFAFLIPECGGGGGEHAAISTGVTATLPTATRTTPTRNAMPGGYMDAWSGTQPVVRR